ncbi:rRNA pseudouridine synthase [bacterium]|nr:rRNA pseudouridine synthase [candidate division CSSED10-310 bacterium]
MSTTHDIPLVRFLARAGIGSRRYCDNLIALGRVTLNSAPATPGARVVPGRDQIRVNGSIIEEAPVLLYYLVYKPKGYLVSDSDPENRPLARDLLPDLGMRMFPVGRLDFQTEGALMFTNDGLWADRVAHPRNTIPKTYLAKVRNIPSRTTLQRWLAGIRDQGQILKAREAVIERTTGRNAWVRITLTGGANRQVRRMGEATGHPVVKLIRLSIGDVHLKDMKPGDVRELTVREVKSFLRKNFAESTPSSPESDSRSNPKTPRKIVRQPMSEKRSARSLHADPPTRHRSATASPRKRTDQGKAPRRPPEQPSNHPDRSRKRR